MRPVRWVFVISAATATLIGVKGQNCIINGSYATAEYDIDGFESSFTTPSGNAACCKLECGTCEQRDCDQIPAPGSESGELLPEEECCPTVILSQLDSCVESGAAPCIISGNAEPTNGPTPGPTPPPTETPPPGGKNNRDDSACSEGTSSSSSDSGSGATSAGMITLAVLLAALLLGNAICCFKRCKKSPTPVVSSTPLGPPQVHGPDTELGSFPEDLQVEHSRRIRAEQDLQEERNRRIGAEEDLQVERNRRTRAEALVVRATGGGIRGDFPNVRDVDPHVGQLADYALTWTEQACAVGGSHAALPGTIKHVLLSTFLVCGEEVKRCVGRRLEGLSEILGDDEPIDLYEGNSMNLDTQYVMYECLCRNFLTIVPLEPQHMRQLGDMVQQRCVQRGAADEALASAILSGDAWPSFDNLMQKYIRVFLEMALQKPPMDFNDDIGVNAVFDPTFHRDWAPHLPPGNQCRVVFPTLLEQEGRPKSSVKAGVVRLPAT